MKGNCIDGKYEIVRQLGQGGMGAVYEARHRTTGRKVAVKVIVPAALAGGADIITRFEREVRASGAIDSPYVVQVFDAGVDPETGAPYMAMECLHGEDVQHLIQRLGPVPPQLALRICAHACHGLQKAHEAGIVHRDIKSANLFLSRREGDAHELLTKILDFGIAKVRASPLTGESHSLTRTGSMLGSPLFMSPEQAIGSKQLDARSDLFSMGVMMYETLAGVTPNGHLDNLGALLIAICSQPARPVQDLAPWVPREVAAIVHKALAINPDDRFQTAAELRGAALALLPGESATISENMLRSLSAEARSYRAPRLMLSEMAFTPGLRATTPLASLAPLAPWAGGSPSLDRSSSNRSTAASVVEEQPFPQASKLSTRSTSAGFGTNIPVFAEPQKRSASPIIYVAALAILALAGGGLLLAKDKLSSTRQAPAALTSDPGPAVTASALPAPRDRSRTDSVALLTPDASAEVDGVEITVPAPSATPVAPPPPPQGPRGGGRPAAAPPPPPASPVVQPSRGPAPHVSTSPAPARNCDPPYTIDSFGHHLLKPGC